MAAADRLYLDDPWQALDVGGERRFVPAIDRLPPGRPFEIQNEGDGRALDGLVPGQRRRSLVERQFVSHLLSRPKGRPASPCGGRVPVLVATGPGRRPDRGVWRPRPRARGEVRNGQPPAIELEEANIDPEINPGMGEPEFDHHRRVRLA